MIQDAIARLLDGADLTRGEAREVMATVMDGHATSAQIAGLLVALGAKGETSDEIAGFADAMRSRVIEVTPTRAPCDRRRRDGW